MKKANAILSLILVAVLLCGMLSGCSMIEAKKIELLAGSWVSITPDSEENARVLLEGVEFYEEEIALVDLSSLNEAILVEFRPDHTYRFAYDLDALRGCVRDFYLGAFASLYENRASLNEVYGVDFTSMSEAEFQQFYAEIYGYSSFDAMVSYMADIGYDYESLSADLETGTYAIKGSDIMCTITGEREAEALGYKIDGNTLILIFSDGTEYYTRTN